MWDIERLDVCLHANKINGDVSLPSWLLPPFPERIAKMLLSYLEAFLLLSGSHHWLTFLLKAHSLLHLMKRRQSGDICKLRKMKAIQFQSYPPFLELKSTFLSASDFAHLSSVSRAANFSSAAFSFWPRWRPTENKKCSIESPATWSHVSTIYIHGTFCVTYLCILKTSRIILERHAHLIIISFFHFSNSFQCSFTFCRSLEGKSENEDGQANVLWHVSDNRYINSHSHINIQKDTDLW